MPKRLSSVALVFCLASLIGSCGSKIPDARCCADDEWGSGCVVVRELSLEECQVFGKAAGCKSAMLGSGECTGTVNGQAVSSRAACCEFRDCDSVPSCQ